MFFELIATFAAGIAVAGLALIAGHLSGGRLPRWITPVAAGAAMLGYAVWSEYTWAERTMQGLPDGVEVLTTVEETRFWKPWTYVVPQTTRIMALDRQGVQTKPDAEGILLADVYLFARWTPPAKRPQLVDCADGARADVSTAALADPDNATWRRVGGDDPLIEALCPS
jgi:Zn-dependent protease with chaperone function